MKRLAFLAMMVAIAACATEGGQTDSAAAADSARIADSTRLAQARLDSLRADSLRKDSVAKGLIKDTTAAK
jgi:hypothetical protein